MISLIEDCNIISMVDKHNVDVVISSSAFIALIDNHEPSFSHSWEIPIKVIITNQGK